MLQRVILTMPGVDEKYCPLYLAVCSSLVVRSCLVQFIVPLLFPP